MRNLKRAIRYSFYALLSTFLISCDGGEVHHKTTSNYVTVVIEDCEYIYNAMIGERSMVHKGNCKSEIHKCNCR